MKGLSYVLAVAGALIVVGLIGYFGLENVTQAVGHIGWPEFGIILTWQLVLFAVLGLAWYAITPAGGAAHAGVLIWARMVRDASGTCLPFSQLGGFVFGTRAATLLGVGWTTATATTIVDVTAEFLAQIAFTAVGLGILLARAPDSAFAVPVEVGLGLAVVGCFAFMWLQNGAAPLFAKLGRLIASGRLEDAKERVAVIQAELAMIYGHAPRLALGFAIHLIGWLMAGAAGWIIYRALGVPIDFDDVLAIEALLSALAAAAFMVPVNAGVQEAGYAGLGAIFGVPPELSIGVSLIRRARDVVVGVPILLLWQYLEVRRLRTVVD